MRRTAKIVFLILAHKPEPFNLLMKLFDDRFDCIVHVDARVPIGPFKAGATSKVRFIETRTPVFWCGSNMMVATLDLIRAAIETVPDFDRIALISGDSLPTTTLETVAAVLSQPDVEFIETVEVQNDPSLRDLDPAVAQERYGWRQPSRFQTFVYWDHELLNPRDRRDAAARYTKGSEKERNRLRHEIEAIAATILADLPPRPPLFEKFYYGAQWWAVSRDAVLAMQQQLFSDEIRSYFKYFRCPDEHFIHCVFGNNPDLKARKRQPFMFSTHLGGGDAQRPHLELSRLKTVYLQKKRLFARKFDPAATPGIADSILQGDYFFDLYRPGDGTPSEAAQARSVKAIHAHWTSHLTLSDTDNSVTHQAHGSRGTYSLENGVLTIQWDKFPPDTFIERSGEYFHEQLADSQAMEKG